MPGDQDKSLASVEIERTRNMCAGSAASYLVRKIAMNAGHYEPGIQDKVLENLGTNAYGRTLEGVEQWYRSSLEQLSNLGFRVAVRRVAFRTGQICQWVQRGSGYRGAVLVTNRKILHPEITLPGSHAVAITAGLNGKSRTPLLHMIDPWPGYERCNPPATLETAHRERNYGALVVFWLGWS